MRIGHKSAVALPLLLLPFANSVAADPITFRFQGTVIQTNLSGIDLGASLPGLGEPVIGTLRIDVNSPDLAPVPGNGAYRDPNALISVGTIGGRPLEFPEQNYAEVLDYPYGGIQGPDQVRFYAMTSDQQVTADLLFTSTIGFDTLHGESIPLDANIYSSFPSRTLTVTFLPYVSPSGEGIELLANLHSFEPVTPAPVPEPTSMVLLGTGLTGLTWRARNRLRQRAQEPK